jgi:ferredoxin
VGCIGCGKCVKACKFEAVKVEDNLARIDPALCRNCGLCIKACPLGAIESNRKAKAGAKAGAVKAATAKASGAAHVV